MSSKKDDEHLYYNNKTTIIQEARVFNESPINPRKCRSLLTRIVYLLYTGENFATNEATQLFFGVTKLFQHKDPALRQTVYLAIKELSDSSEDVIMVTAILMKDMQSNADAIYRPNAIRALCRIIDPSMVQNIERFYKAALTDRNTSISSAALISSYHLYPVAKDVIKRWVNEAQEAVNAKPPSFPSSSGGGFSASTFSSVNISSAGGYLGFGSGGSRNEVPQTQTIPSTSYITQYHALGLLYAIRQSDRMAVTKMVQGYGNSGKGGSQGSLKNPMAVCMLIRFAAKIAEEDPNMSKPMLDLIESYLRHKSDLVTYEAARSLCSLASIIPSLPSATLTRAVSQLQLFLSSPKATLKFAALRTLSSLSLTHPSVVATCNIDLENCISDSNRSVSTYAITTLLKTGTESSVERLMKTITGFMSEIGDEFKVLIVDAIRALCVKFPSKQGSMLGFLAGVLRDEGGYEFKRSVVEAIFDLISWAKDSTAAVMDKGRSIKEEALAQLAEFIEDCEFTKLSVRVLHLLGVEGPKAKEPGKFIRYIYNRVVLENAIVRAAAVTSLAKFGVMGSDPSVKRSVGVLLNRCLDDVDDEVRDRAAMYLRVMKEEDLVEPFVKDDSIFSLATLESKLVEYVNNPEAQTKPFDMADIPKVSREQAQKEAARPTTLDTITASVVPQRAPVQEAAPAPTAQEAHSAYAKQLTAIPEFEDYGKLINSSSKATPLTESETEYVVNVVKHMFKEHIVFQFNISNTIPDTVLENVAVVMQPSGEGLTEDLIIPVDSLSLLTGSQPVYVSFTRVNPDEYSLGTFSCSLKFVSKEVDPSSGMPEETGYPDEYQLEEVELGAADWIMPSWASFEAEWAKLEEEVEEEFALSSMASIKAAVDSLVEVLNMEALAGSDNPSSTAVHTLLLSGLVGGGGGKVLARCQMAYTASSGVSLRLNVRAEKEEVAQLVIAAIG